MRFTQAPARIPGIHRAKLNPVLVALLGCLALLTAPAATITISSTADSGSGTLREALATAADGDTINFSATGTISLTTGELLVSKNVNILGPGENNLAVDANGASRVFRIGPTKTVSIAGLSIRNGFTAGFLPTGLGGGIFNDHATLTISNCTLSGNSASDGGGGAIFNYARNGGTASLLLINCTLSRNFAYQGGGIWNLGQDHGSAAMRIVNSLLTSNTASGPVGAIFNDGYYGTASTEIVNSTITRSSANYNGGAIYNGGDSGTGTLRIINSTLSGNSTHDDGGAINNLAQWGSADVKIINSTLSGNAADYGGCIANHGSYGTGTVQIVCSTFSGNSVRSAGSSIWNQGGTFEIGSTIFNDAASGGSISSLSGAIISLGYNLSIDNAGGFLTRPTDHIKRVPLLGPLLDNGGPTFTHALLACSPAIDRGKNLTASTNDQRGAGFIRSLDNAALPNENGGDGTDIGAFEVQSAPNPFTVVNTNDFGPGSLRQAILNANANPGPHVIDICPSLRGVIWLVSGELLITSDLVVTGPGANNLSVDGNAASRVFHIASNAVVTISALTITRGHFEFPSAGGGIFNDHASLTVSNCVISNNSGRGFGAGIFSTGRDAKASLTVINSTITGNSSPHGSGGGIYSEYATLTVENSIVTTNSADAYGGGIYTDNSTVNISRTTLVGNRATSSGGGMIIVQSSVNLSNSTLSANFAGFSGGAISSTSGSSLNIINCTLSANSAARFGGAIRDLDPSTSTFRVVNSTLSGNSAPFAGAISSSASLEIGSTILNADDSGGTLAGDGPIISLGHNLSSDGAAGQLLDPTDQTNTDPLLGPLQDNGGPTFTHALLCGSPAIDAGTNFSAAATDQRGGGSLRTYDHPFVFNAPGGDGTDIGAFESQGICKARFTAFRREPNGPFQMEFSGEMNRTYVIEASTDTTFPNWEAIGAATAQGGGYFVFEDTHATSFSRRFYRARLQ